MIEFQNIWKTYAKEIGTPANVALRDVSFSVYKGQTLGLIGANGAGKSTCIRLILDFIRAEKGTVTLFDTSPRHAISRNRIGYLPEIPHSPESLSVMEIMNFTGKTCLMGSKDIKESAEKWLTRFGLWEVRKRPIRTYSKGMKQRAHFAIALINNPELLILDEPMSGLDPLGREEIFSLLESLKAEGRTILFCSHILEDVDRLVDQVLVLHKGQKLFFGLPGDLIREEEKDTFIQAFINRIGKG